MPKKIVDDRILACEHCGATHIKVIDSRPSDIGLRKRRYSCEGCGWRFTTLEVLVSSGKSGLNDAHAKAALTGASPKMLLDELQARGWALAIQPPPVEPPSQEVPPEPVKAATEPVKKPPTPAKEAKPKRVARAQPHRHEGFHRIPKDGAKYKLPPTLLNPDPEDDEPFGETRRAALSEIERLSERREVEEWDKEVWED